MKTASIVTKLQPHQVKAIEKALENHRRGLIIAHGLGSGKTLTSIAIADKLGKQTDVIVPASLVDNYQKEIDKHTKNPVPFNVLSIQRAMLHPDELTGETLIVDEAHRLRNEKANSYGFIDSLPHSKKVLLTGTPVYNNPVDAANLINIIDKEDHNPKLRLVPSRIRRFLGRPEKEMLEFEIGTHLRPDWRSMKRIIKTNPSIEDLKQRLVKLNDKNYSYYPSIEQIEKDLNNTPERRQVRVLARYLGSLENIKKREEKVLHEQEFHKAKMTDKMNKYVDYFPGGDSKEYPTKTIENIPVKLDKETQKEYDRATAGMSENLLKKIYDAAIPELTPEEASNPLLIESRTLSNSPSKIDRMFKDIKKEPGKSLVYSNFLDKGLYQLGAKLDKANIPYKYFTGEDKNRKEIVDTYNAGLIKALLVSSAGGEGLDLKNTKQVQIMEPHWNKMKIDQVIGRAARFRSHSDLPEKERIVKIKQYVSSPIEDYLQRLGAKKEELGKGILGMYDENYTTPDWYNREREFLIEKYGN